MHGNDQLDPAVNRVHVLWDESYYWALMLWRALLHGGVPFRLVRAAEIASGLLQRNPPGVLLVPGGWARFKSAALGPGGRRAVAAYLEAGGAYLGFCGGAGLALPEHGGLALCPLCRKPVSERLPNFSGSVSAALHGHELVPEGLPAAVRLPVWWPSQFAVPKAGDVRVLASYLEPGPDFWVSDLAWEDIRGRDLDAWRRLYGINLDPGLLAGEPCVITGSCGQGRYILSYAHLESPESATANSWLGHMLSLLSGQPSAFFASAAVPTWDLQNQPVRWDDPTLARMVADLEDILAMGLRHFLLFWRRPWILGWRRGVPGFVLTTLYAQVVTARSLEPDAAALEYWEGRAADAAKDSARFRERMIAYLLAERLAMHQGEASSPEACSSESLQARRNALLGEFPGYSGLFGRIAGTLDGLLWFLCRARGKG